VFHSFTADIVLKLALVNLWLLSPNIPSKSCDQWNDAFCP